MKVRELMSALRQYDLDAEVWVEWKEDRCGDVHQVRPDGPDPIISRVHPSQGESMEDRLDRMSGDIEAIKAGIRDLMS